MADPAVRLRISERTKQGMRAAAEWMPELRRLRDAWHGARSDVRRRFLAEVLAPVTGGTAE
jgi:hypothetical protein